MSAASPVEVVPTGFAKVIHRLLRTGDHDTRSVSYGVNVTATDIAGLAVTAGECHQAWVDNVVPAWSDEWRIVETEVRGSPADGGFVISSGASTPGLDVDEPPSSNCALLVEKHTSVAGRGNQGRMFVPGLPQEDSIGSGGGIETVKLAALQTLWDAFLADVNSGANTTDMVLFHADYIRDPAIPYDPLLTHQGMMVNPNANTPVVVTNLSVDPILATQRRRMR